MMIKNIFVTIETPLTATAMLDEPIETMKILIQYGAFLDFRTKSGKTALHNVAIIGKDKALKVRR